MKAGAIMIMIMIMIIQSAYLDLDVADFSLRAQDGASDKGREDVSRKILAGEPALDKAGAVVAHNNRVALRVRHGGRLRWDISVIAIDVLREGRVSLVIRFEVEHQREMMSSQFRVSIEQRLELMSKRIYHDLARFRDQRILAQPSFRARKLTHRTENDQTAFLKVRVSAGDGIRLNEEGVRCDSCRKDSEELRLQTSCGDPQSAAQPNSISKEIHRNNTNHDKRKERRAGLCQYAEEHVSARGRYPAHPFSARGAALRTMMKKITAASFGRRGEKL